MHACGAQAGTHPVSVVPRLGAHANLVELGHSTARKPRLDNHRVMPSKNRAVSTFDLRVAYENFAARESGTQLYAPRSGGALAHSSLQLRDEGIRLALDNDGQILARGSAGIFPIQLTRTSCGPIVRRTPGHR